MSRDSSGQFGLPHCARDIFNAIALLAFIALLTACGPKHPNTANQQPLPPPIETAPQQVSPPPPAITSETEVSRKPLYVEEGIASWYGPPYHNRRGSNGEIYDMHAMTAAHRTLPLNSLVRVTNVKTNHTAILRITDRGPFIAGRVLDVSLAAAKALDIWAPGTARVRIEVLDTPAAIDRGGRWCVQIGAFQSPEDAAILKEKLQSRYRTAKVLQFTGPTGEWLRVRVSEDDKQRAESVVAETRVGEGAVFLVRLD